MRKLTCIFLGVTAVYLPLTSQIEAVGGREGGFRGEPREGRGLQNNHSPSMSRSLPLSKDTLLEDPNSSIFARPRGEGDSGTQETFKNRQDLTPKVQTERSTSQGNRELPSTSVDVNERKNWFNASYWKNHPNSWYRHPENMHWWDAAKWGSVAAWVPWKWTTPVDYRYGVGGNVYVQDNSIYIDGREVASQADYTRQIAQILANIPPIDVDTVEWLPIGVFALTADSMNPTATNMYLQLAISKQGVISGTYINTTTGANQEVQGMVDQQSQRAVWKILGNGLIMETGIYNLTEKQSQIWVHFPEGILQTWRIFHINP